MKIEILKDCRFSPDGFASVEGIRGEVIETSKFAADALIDSGLAREIQTMKIETKEEPEKKPVLKKNKKE